MCKNLELYNAVRQVPKEAQKEIQAGRLRGKTDVNPMWRIKKLTEQFGPCGFGWYPETLGQWLEHGADGEVTANVRIHLYVKMNEEWSKPIEGIGGAMFISKEKGGLYTDDDAYKKAYTDAISVACKALGVAADVYWDKDPTKYTEKQQYNENKPKNEPKTDKKPQSVKPLTKSELIGIYGLESPDETIQWFERKAGKSLAEFDAEETAAARAILDKKKQERDAEKRKKGLRMIDDQDIPFPMGD